eukprot:Gb_30823 [translate_table: standard]
MHKHVTFTVFCIKCSKRIHFASRDCMSSPGRHLDFASSFLDNDQSRSLLTVIRSENQARKTMNPSGNTLLTDEATSKKSNHTYSGESFRSSTSTELQLPVKPSARNTHHLGLNLMQFAVKVIVLQRQKELSGVLSVDLAVCVVIMEGDPKPGALTGRMSFQNFNPSIDFTFFKAESDVFRCDLAFQKLNEAIGDIHNQRASTTGTADRNGMDICRENETLQFGNDGSNKHRENEDLGQDLHRKKLRVEEDDQASYRSPKHAVTDNGNQLSADRGRKTKQEHSKLDWRHLRPPTGRTKRL